MLGGLCDLGRGLRSAQCRDLLPPSAGTYATYVCRVQGRNFSYEEANQDHRRIVRGGGGGHDTRGATWCHAAGVPLAPCYDTGHQSPPWGTTTVFRETMWKWSDDTLVLRVGVGPDRVHEGVIQISLSTLAPGEPSDCYRA